MIRIAFACLVGLVFLAAAAAAQAGAVDFEPPLPEGLKPLAPQAGTLVSDASRITRHYAAQGVVFDGVALVSLPSPSKATGEFGIAGINADGSLDAAATVAFSFVAPDDKFKPAATDTVELTAEILAESQRVSIVVNAYGVDGTLLDTVSYNGTGDDRGGITLEIQNPGGIHLVVIEQYQNVGGVVFDRLAFGELTPAAIKINAAILPRSGMYRPASASETLSVAVLGHSTFSVLEIDPATCLFAGMGVRFEDGRYLEHIEDVNLDGYPDLVLQIDTSDGGFDRNSPSGLLTGDLFDGTPFEGSATWPQ